MQDRGCGIQGVKTGGDDPTALVRVNFVGLKRPGTAAKIK